MSVDLSQWVPERLRWDGEGARVEWIHTGGRRFTHPFFEDDLRAFRRAPSATVFERQGTLEELEAWADERPGLAPAGFIFHLSRCGSTLISRMLRAADCTRVIPEAAPIDDCLRLEFRRPPMPAERIEACLRAVVSALGQPSGSERHYFIKWDCWHTHHLTLLRRAFPRTPWIFLYRDPLEILASQMRAPGMWTVPGVLDAELTAAADWKSGREAYCAQLLAGICRAAIEQRATLVNYAELPAAVCPRLTKFFGVEYSAEERERMFDVARFDAKGVHLPFAADSEAKRRATSPAMRDACARWVDGIYHEMEKLRQSGQGLPV